MVREPQRDYFPSGASDRWDTLTEIIGSDYFDIVVEPPVVSAGIALVLIRRRRRT